MKHYVYILQSLKDKKWYIGSTGDVIKRLTQHNNHQVRSTKAHAPYKIIYTEQYEDKTIARKREIYLKNNYQEREKIKRSLKNPPLSSSG